MLFRTTALLQLCLCLLDAVCSFLCIDAFVVPWPFGGKDGAGYRTGTDGSRGVTPPIPSLGDAAARSQARALWHDVQKRQLLHPCWKMALASLEAQCAHIHAEDSLRMRLALGLAACDASTDGRDPSAGGAFACGSREDARRCVQRLSDASYAVFVQYRLHTDVLCIFLQEEVFQERTERAVRDLQAAAAEGIDSLEALRTASEWLATVTERNHAEQAELSSLAQHLHTELQGIQRGQRAAATDLAATTAHLLGTAQETQTALDVLQTNLHTASRHATERLEALSAASAAHFDMMEDRTTGLLGALGRVEELQDTLLSESMTASLGKAWASLLAAAYFLTGASRTAAVRAPCMAAVLIGMGWTLRCRWLAFAPHPVCQAVPPHGVLLLAAAVVAGFVLRAGWAYEPPIHQQRRILREEMERFTKLLFPHPPSSSTAAAAPVPPPPPPPLLTSAVDTSATVLGFPSARGRHSVPVPLTLALAEHTPPSVFSQSRVRGYRPPAAPTAHPLPIHIDRGTATDSSEEDESVRNPAAGSPQEATRRRPSASVAKSKASPTVGRKRPRRGLSPPAEATTDPPPSSSSSSRSKTPSKRTPRRVRGQ